MSDIRLIIQYENGNLKDVSAEAKKELEKAGSEGGKSFGSKFNESAGNAVTKAALGVAAAVTAAAAATLFKGIEAAAEGEQNLNKLNTALQLTGIYTKETSQALADYAGAIQTTTKFEDDAVLSAQALIQNLGNLSEKGLKEATKTAVDLSAALGIDLQTAATMVGKAAAGEVGSFGKLGIKIQEGATASETFSNALTVLQGKFGGAAEKEVNTFAGAIAQATNSYGEYLEKIGDIIIKQPIIIKGIQAVGKYYEGAAQRVVDFGEKFDIFDDLLFPLIDFAEGVNLYVLTPLELIKNVGQVVLGAINSFVATTIAGYGQLGGVIASVLDKFGALPEVSEALKTFEETSAATAISVNKDFTQTLASTLDTPLTDSIAARTAEIRTGLQEQREIIAAEGMLTGEVLTTNIAAAATATQSYGSLLLDTLASITFVGETTKERMAEVAKTTSDIVKNGIAKSISGGIQNIVTSLANGENAFANFGKFLLSTFGDLAIQLGTFFIAEGIAVEALNAVSGTGAIAAGAALVALGALLKSAGGGGKASAGGAGGGSAGSSATNPTFTQGVKPNGEFVEEARVTQGPSTQISINVEGNIRDDEAFTRKLVEDLGREGGKQGLTFNNFRTV